MPKPDPKQKKIENLKNAAFELIKQISNTLNTREAEKGIFRESVGKKL